MKPKRLGRGLDFLLGAPESATGTTTVEDLDLAQIIANPWQPRSAFDDAALEDLARSIRRHGVVQPIVVRRHPNGGYELVAGERRMLAARKVGLTSIPAVIRDCDDRDMLMVALIENVQRQDLNPLERARAFLRLVNEQGLSHQEVADAAGLARSTVSNVLRLLELDAVAQAELAAGRISEGHARALLAEPDPNRRSELLRRIADGNLTVREVEEENQTKGTRKAAKSGRKASADARELEKKLAERLGLKVRILERGSAGRVVVSYRTLADFERLYTVVMGAPPGES